MTEKRFKLIGDNNLEFLMQHQLELPIYDYQNNNKRLSLSNALDLLNSFNEENKQLKAQLYCNHNDGVCSICKHCYLEEQSYYYISKCEKGHEQCSKENLRYCDDFELKGDME